MQLCTQLLGTSECQFLLQIQCTLKNSIEKIQNILHNISRSKNEKIKKDKLRIAKFWL